ncbi:hypothetical protein [Nitrospira defluvii]|uniref:hypothetical protein n=1 Tax=Nitrospira defluvii TaxID=330214 RepID=UPI001BB4736C|nr:hypothetical protein [Nitrospira defluvii]
MNDTSTVGPKTMQGENEVLEIHRVSRSSRWLLVMTDEKAGLKLARTVTGCQEIEAPISMGCGAERHMRRRGFLLRHLVVESLESWRALVYSAKS